MYLIHPIESKIIKGTQNNLCENWGEVRFFILGAKTAEDNAITQIDLTKLSTAEVKKYSEREKVNKKPTAIVLHILLDSSNICPFSEKLRPGKISSTFEGILIFRVW